MKRPPAITLYEDSGSFHDAAHRACFALSRVEHTKRAYWNDTRKWLEFCSQLGIDPKDPHEDAATLWIESMERSESAPKTIARRIAGVCSVYRRLCTRRGGKVATWNPFSIEEGLARNRALAVKPTPLAPADSVTRMLATCGDDELGKRDAAILRILWATGARRASLLAMTFERLRKDRDAYIARLIVKGGKELPVLIRGKAATALKAWLEVMSEAKLTKGPIWRGRKNPLSARELDRMIRRRAKKAGVKPPSPHTFRVSFLTHNPASLEAKQDAAGHASPETTRLYDRASWRGREAFEKMPEVEDTTE